MNKLLIKKIMNSNSMFYKVSVGLLCALNYAIYPTLIFMFSLTWKGSTDTSSKIALGFTLVTAKELFCFLIYFIIAGPTNFMKDIRLHLFSKNGAIITIAGMFGGPIGYSLVTIGALFIGGALAATLTATSTIFTALFEFSFLKRRFNRIKVIGIVIASISTILLSLMAIDQWNWTPKAILGILFSLAGALSWTTENVLMDYGMGKGTKLESSSALKIKLLTSAIVMLTVFMPLVTLATGHADISYTYFTKFFSDLNMFWGIAAVGLFISLARFFFLKSIKLQGATTGFMWSTISNILTPLIILMFIGFGLDVSTGDTSILKTWWFWIFGLSLLAGVIISALEIETKKGKCALKEFWKSKFSKSKK